MNKIQSLAVFCGSSQSNNSHFIEIAKELGSFLAKTQVRMIYGGAQVGLMGEVANACLQNGGEVYGVIPEFLSAKEIVHTGLTQLFHTQSMHERKAKMAELADGFIAIPGGFGTLDELFEILTWAQLGLHSKPIGLLNVDHFFNPLLAMIENMHNSQLLNKANKDMPLVSDNVPDLIQKIREYKAPADLPKWIKKSEES